VHSRNCTITRRYCCQTVTEVINSSVMPDLWLQVLHLKKGTDSASIGHGVTRRRHTDLIDQGANLIPIPLMSTHAKIAPILVLRTLVGCRRYSSTRIYITSEYHNRLSITAFLPIMSPPNVVVLPPYLALSTCCCCRPHPWESFGSVLILGTPNG
jgi:hypothetical protein